MSTFGPIYPLPLGVSYASSGGSPADGPVTFTYTIANLSGYADLGWGQGLPDAGMDGSVTTLTYSAMDSAADSSGMTAVWVGTTSVSGHNYSGTVYVKLVAVIQSGATGWSAESWSSAPGDPAVVALINSDKFSVSLEYFASSSPNGTYVPFDTFYNDAGVIGGSGGAQVDTDGEFAGVLNAVSVATFLANQSGLDGTGGFDVSDTAAAIGGMALDALNGDANITTITVSDNAAVAVSVDQLTSDASALGKLANADASPYQLAVSDTASNVEAGLGTIESDLSHIASITLTSGTVSVSVSQFGLDQGALDKIAGGFAISDTAAAIGGMALDALNGDANITAITVSDNAAVAVSIDQLTSDASALGILANADASPYQLAVSDTASNVEAGLGTIESDLSHIASVTLTSGTVSVSVSQFGLDQGALDKIAGGFAISDTAAAIGGTALDALNGDANITAITVSDNAAVAVSVDQLTSDASALGMLANADASPYQLAVSDTVANVTSALAALTAAASHIATITATGGKVSVSTAAFAANKAALDKIAGGFAISDTAANVTSGLAALTADASHIAAITATGGKVSVSTAAFAANKAALDKIVGGFAVSDTVAKVTSTLAALTADASHIAAITATGGKVSVSTSAFTANKAVLDKIAGGFAISDTVAKVTSALAALEKDVAKIDSIRFINSGTHVVLSLTAAQSTADANLVAKITGNYVLNVANTNGTTTTTGHGNGLLINDVAGHDTITGGGNNETFAFGAGFGHAVITDFYGHTSGTTHDTISLRSSEFASFAALYHHASQVGTSVIITGSNGDSLTLQGMTLASLHAASADFKFI